MPADRSAYREIRALQLTAEHFPLPCSLLARVKERYGVANRPGEADLEMALEELLAYLRNLDYDKFDPMPGILAQTEAIGDPALPTSEQTAILNWLGAAIRDWDRHLGLEEPLAAELRRLRPLMAAMAITQPGFLTPGAHPLHQLLDAIQLHAVGWQPRLGRLGQALETQVRNLVDAALAWFNAPRTDLAALHARLAADIAKTRARSRLMRQRLVETEHGRIRIAESKRQAAVMINAALRKYAAPADIGDFLKGPWYDSAQLVLLKFGENSVQWKEMSPIAAALLASLQPPAGDGKARSAQRQRLFELAARLPQDLRKWLLSLPQDGDALTDAIGLVEYFHSMVLGGKTLELQKISPLALQDHGGVARCTDASLDRFQEGRWVVLDTRNSPSLRAMLALRMEEEQQMLFANQAGIKVLQLSFTELARLAAKGKVALIDTDGSFSRSLARSAGVETQEDLDELTGVAGERARLREEERLQAELEQARLEQQRAERERVEQEMRLREQEAIRRRQREMEEAERIRREHEAAERQRREQVELERQRLVLEQAEAGRLQQNWEQLARRLRDRAEPGRPPPSSRRERGTERLPDGMNLNLPTGTWLGFRDGDEVTLARMAVYDREQNHYIFVDRHGIKVKQLGGRQLLILLTRGLVDILENRSRFSDVVVRAQRQSRQ